MTRLTQNKDRWFPIITRRGAILLGWLESAGFGDKLLEFTELNLTSYKEIRIVKNKEYTLFLEGVSWSKVESKFKKRLERDKDYLNQIYKKYNSRLFKLERFSKLIDLRNLSDLKLIKLILTYADLYTDIAPFYIVYNEVRPILKEKTESWLKEKVPLEDVQEYHIALTTPLKPLYAVEEDKELQKIVKEIKSQRKILNLFKKEYKPLKKNLLKISPSISSKISDHLALYYWVPVERDNPPWSLDDIITRIKYKLTKNVKQQKTSTPLEKKQRQYEKQLGIPPNMLTNFKNLRNLMSAVDAMKKTYAISHCFLSNLLEETARRLEINKNSLYFFTPKEIVNFLEKQERPTKTELKLRRNSLVIGHRVEGKWQVEIIKGPKARYTITKLTKAQKIKEQKLIKGIPASPGKVVGMVKVLRNASEANKLSREEILVAPMTTPDYIIAIHKAAAIVTDEGGVLCHAAIVSREFGIPCVIGTKIATKILKDGDIVEVDATKGIVRKIMM